MVGSWLWAWVFPIKVDSIKFMLAGEWFNGRNECSSVSFFNSSREERWWEGPSSNRSYNFQVLILGFVSYHCLNLGIIWWINCCQFKWLFAWTISRIPIRLWLTGWWAEEWKSIIDVGKFINNWSKIFGSIFIWGFSISSPISVINSYYFFSSFCISLTS